MVVIPLPRWTDQELLEVRKWGLRQHVSTCKQCKPEELCSQGKILRERIENLELRLSLPEEKARVVKEYEDKHVRGRKLIVRAGLVLGDDGIWRKP